MSVFWYLVYVDDILIRSTSEIGIDKVKRFLTQKFTIKYLGHAKYFLGLELVRFENGIFVNQMKYAMDLLQDTGTYDGLQTNLLFSQKLQIKWWWWWRTFGWSLSLLTSYWNVVVSWLY